MTVVGTYDSDQQKIFFTKPVDIASDVDITGPALNITGDVNLSGNLTVGGSSPGGDIVVAAGSEYFQAQLTDYQTNINDLALTTAHNTYTPINFQGLGTQTGDTSNWDGTNNAYELASTGLYQISFNITFPGIYVRVINGSYSMQYPPTFVVGLVQYSTDNFATSTTLFSATSEGEYYGSKELYCVNGQGLFSPTSANTKIRLLGACYGISSTVSPPGSYLFIAAPYIKTRDAMFYDDLTGSPTPPPPGATADLPGATMFNVVRLH